MKPKKPTNDKPKVPDALAGLNPILGLFSMADTKRVKIKNIHGKEIEVSLELPAAREIKILEPIGKIRARIEVMNLKVPARAQGEDENQYYSRVSSSMLGSAGNLLMNVVSADAIEAAALILGESVESVGENYRMEELIGLVIPFFGSFLSGMLRRAASVSPTKTEPDEASASSSDS
jgi:hypothetical protein